MKTFDLTFATGPAGTGKTWMSAAYAAQQLDAGLIEKIVITRPAVEAGEKLGFLPGDLKEKIDPYLRPLYDALFERYGIARMKSVSAFAETLKFLHNGGPIADSRLVSLSCSGGEAALVADMALEKKVSFPPFNAATKPRVAATLNEYVSIDNPLDYHTFIWGQPEKLTATFTEVLKGGFDVGMVILDTPTHPKMKPEAWATTARAMAAASKATGARAAIVASLSEGMPLSLADELSASGVAPMMGLDDALTAFEAAARLGSFRLAASELGITRSAVSHQVKSLEQRLGVQLRTLRVDVVAGGGLVVRGRRRAVKRACNLRINHLC
jgi:acyl-CoA synthetase (NDP forming)